jgi:radical SAM protein with 4Fe4S-binding SPASM domain
MSTKVVDSYGHINIQKSENTLKWEKARTPRQKLEFQKWSVYPENFMVDRVPLSIDFEATSKCNLQCRMCPRTQLVEEGRFWKEEHADLNLYIRLVDEAAKKGVGGIKYNFLGEPLINHNLPFMVHYAKYKGIPMVMFNTNAVLLTPKVSEQLIDSGLDQLFFSVDSSDPLVYSTIRKGGNLEKVVDNIITFHKIRRKKGSISPHTRFHIVLTKDNETELEHLEENPLFKVVDSFSYAYEFEHTNSEKLGEVNYCCPQLWQRMFIHPDGVVTPCCADVYRELVVGSVKNSSLEEIWTGIKYRRLRSLHKEGNAKAIPTCSSCYLVRAQGGD